MISSELIGSKRQKRENLVGIPQNFDLESYFSNYNGKTRVDRLFFILSLCPGLRQNGYPLLIKELMDNCIDTTKYQEAVSEYNEVLKDQNLSPIKLDREFIERSRHESSTNLDALAVKIQQAKADADRNLLHESRMKLSELNYQIGNFENAAQQFTMSRDTAISPSDIIKIWERLILMNLQVKNFSLAYSYIQRFLSEGEIENSIVKAKLNASSGIVLMSQQNFDQAALQFTSISFDLGSQYNEIITANDIAIYGTLCSLASFSRSNLKDLLFNNPSFYQFLEIEPRSRDLVSHFYNANYTEVFEILSSYYEELKLDYFLADGLDTLYSQIKRRALLQYCAPFASLKLSAISNIFELSPTQVIQELTSLIKQGQLQAKLDTYNDVLWSDQVDPRVELYHDALSVGKEFQTTTKTTLAIHKLKQSGLSLD